MVLIGPRECDVLSWLLCNDMELIVLIKEVEVDNLKNYCIMFYISAVFTQSLITRNVYESQSSDLSRV